MHNALNACVRRAVARRLDLILNLPAVTGYNARTHQDASLGEARSACLYGENLSKDRLAAFSDGVIAIIITVMVLELRTPQGTQPQALRPLAPVFLSYVLSFINLGIYWNNHHHLSRPGRSPFTAWTFCSLR